MLEGTGTGTAPRNRDGREPGVRRAGEATECRKGCGREVAGASPECAFVCLRERPRLYEQASVCVRKPVPKTRDRVSGVYLGQITLGPHPTLLFSSKQVQIHFQCLSFTLVYFVLYGPHICPTTHSSGVRALPLSHPPVEPPRPPHCPWSLSSHCPSRLPKGTTTTPLGPNPPWRPNGR